MNDPVTASDRYGLISLAIGVAIGIDITLIFPDWPTWVAVVGGVLASGIVFNTLIRQEAATRHADGTAPTHRTMGGSLAWAAMWFLILTVPILAA